MHSIPISHNTQKYFRYWSRWGNLIKSSVLLLLESKATFPHYFAAASSESVLEWPPPWHSVLMGLLKGRQTARWGSTWRTSILPLQETWALCSRQNSPTFHGLGFPWTFHGLHFPWNVFQLVLAICAALWSIPCDTLQRACPGFSSTSCRIT